MEMKKILPSTLRIVLFTAIILLTNNVLAQSEVIYTEDFAGQSGKGVSGTTTNLGGVDWSIDVSNANLSGNYDYIKVGSVNGNPAMIAKDLDGTAFWYSPTVDISNHSEVRVYLKAKSLTGSVPPGHNSNDFIKTGYSINNGGWTTVESNGYLTGNFGEKWPEHDNLNGNTLRIRVRVKNNDDEYDKFAFGNITMEGIYEETFTNSSGDGLWATSSNWASGSVPISSYNVTISSGQTLMIGNSTAAVANNLTIESGGSLTVAKNSDLTLSGNFTNNGTMTLNSDSDEFSSIIVGGSSTGDIVYNRYVNTVGTGEWDLIGSPVDGLSISDFVTTNSSVLATNGSAYAVGYHDNTDDSWTNYTTSTVGGAGNFDTSRGYQMATSSGATMAFTGSIATTDQTQSIINNNGNGNGGRRWNLVANPYPSYLNANTNAHASNNFLSVNASVIDSNFLSIYGWDADGSGYTIYNNTSSATYIAPGQAFFVAAASSSAADLTFTEAMQTTTGGDDFISLGLANTSSEFSLYLHEGQDKVATTRFYFDYGLGLGLDPGYDAGAYNSSMALSSRLAEDDQGINMGINAMNIDSFEQTTIPLVINREAGTTFRISMEDSTIPDNVDVLLLDTQTQISTNLRDQDFILTPQSDLSGMGRFYLKMGSNSLDGNDIEESYISIYKPSDRDCIVMEGLSNVQSGHVTLYNITGQEVIDQNLTPNQSTQNIPTTGIQSGIYIIKLNADNLILTKKLIIK